MRVSFSRFEADSGSAEQTILRTLPARRSMPSVSAKLARWMAKPGMEISTVGFRVWIRSSCARLGTALPAPTQFMPTPAWWAERAQI